MIGETLAHFNYGIHSNIPECCVREWVANIDNRQPYRGPSVGYVPCQRCARLIRLGLLHPAILHGCDPVNNPVCDAFLRAIWAENIPKYESMKSSGMFTQHRKLNPYVY